MRWPILPQQPWSLAIGEQSADEQTRAVVASGADHQAPVHASERGWLAVLENSDAIENETTAAVVPRMTGQRQSNASEEVVAETGG